MFGVIMDALISKDVCPSSQMILIQKDLTIDSWMILIQKDLTIDSRMVLIQKDLTIEVNKRGASKGLINLLSAISLVG